MKFPSDKLFEQNSEYLPQDVSRIVKKIVEMRINIVETAPHRTQADYVLWPDRGEEHPTQFYPGWPLWRYPKKYNMVGTGVDEDLCQKSFPSGRTFCNGVFRFVLYIISEGYLWVAIVLVSRT